MSEQATTVVTTQEAAAEALGMTVEEFKRLREVEGFPGKAGAYDVEQIREWRQGLAPSDLRDVAGLGLQIGDGGSNATDVDVRHTGSPAGASGVSEPVRRLKVYAGDCPASPRHQATRIYSVKGMTRYCVCDECGATWKKSGEYADELRQYCSELAAALEEAETTPAADGTQVIVLADELRNQVVAKLRSLLKS